MALCLSISAPSFARYAFRSTPTSLAEAGAGFMRIRWDTRVGLRSAYSRASTVPQEWPSSAGESSRKCRLTLSMSSTSDASVTSSGLT